MKLDAKNVSVSIAGTTIVRNLSIEVPDLKFSALLGANGSGKTTLLRSIYRTQKMDSGIDTAMTIISRILNASGR